MHDDIPRLIRELGIRDGGKEEAAMAALAALGPDSILEPLVCALEDRDPLVREKAAELLGRLGDRRATEALLLALKSDDQDLRFAAVNALCMIDDDRAADSIYKAVSKDTYYMVRAYGLEGLAKRVTPRLIEAVIAATGDEDWLVRDSALRVIAGLSRDQLEAYRPKLLSAAINTLKKMGEANEGKATCKALVHIGDAKAIPALVKALGKATNSGVNDNICEALGALRAVDAIDAIVDRALSQSRPWTRRTAAHALAEIGDSRAIPSLSDALKNEDTDWVRNAIKEALKKLGAPAIIVDEAAAQKTPLKIASDPASSASALEALADSSNLDVVLALAHNPSAPPAVLRQLNKKWYSYPSSPRFLWGHFIDNPNCPSDILNEIASKTVNQWTKAAALKHPNYKAPK